MPRQKPGLSKQNYSTPDDFMVAVKRRLHIRAFKFDFAAEKANAKATRYSTQRDDTLSMLGVWHLEIRGGWGWLNSPFDHIEPWAEACYQTSLDGGSVAALWPASVGAGWYRDFVHHKALVLALNGRLAFIPGKPQELYPKDCMLCLFSPLVAPGFDVWTWKPTKEKA